MPFQNTQFFDNASLKNPSSILFPCLRYVIRTGWLEAFEYPIENEGEREEASKLIDWAQSARGLRKDAVSLAKGSFGVFELFLDNGTSTRIADASTKWSHLSSKVLLAQYSTRINHQICPPSGWLRWDCEFDGSYKDPSAFPREGAEFLLHVSEPKPWVMKRDGASGGKGIVFVTNLEQIKQTVDESREIEEALPFVDDRREQIAGWAIQEHITPLLIMGGRKFHIRVYVVSVGSRIFRYDEEYEVRVAPMPWNSDFNAVGCHITNGGGAEAHHERRFLMSEVNELVGVKPKIKEFIAQIFSHPGEEKMELDETWIPASVLGLDIMMSNNDGKLNLLESNHSPASPPYEGQGVFARHVRRLVRRIVSLIVRVGKNPTTLLAEEIARDLGFVELLL